MNEKSLSSGYQEISHVADVALEVWAPDLESFFIAAARGMLALMGVILAEGSLPSQQFQIQGDDPESLLVGFLSELLFWTEEEIGFHTFNLTFTPGCLHAVVAGAKITSQSKEIKAVTFHNLRIQQGESLLQGIIVFDI